MLWLGSVLLVSTLVRLVQIGIYALNSKCFSVRRTVQSRWFSVAGLVHTCSKLCACESDTACFCPEAVLSLPRSAESLWCSNYVPKELASCSSGYLWLTGEGCYIIGSFAADDSRRVS